MTLSLSDNENTYFNIGKDIVIGSLPSDNFFYQKRKV